MTTWKDIIAINDTTSDIFLEDLGLTIPASSQEPLHEQFEFSEISNADYLKIQVTAGNIIINDGTENLLVEDALDYINYWDKYNYRSERTFIDAYRHGSQYLDVDDTYKELDISDVIADYKNMSLDGTSTILIEKAGTYLTNYRVGFYYNGNAATMEYNAIAEVNGVDVPRTKTTGWTHFAESRINLTNGVHINYLEVGDRIKIKAKVLRNSESVIIEYAGGAIHRISDR